MQTIAKLISNLGTYKIPGTGRQQGIAYQPIPEIANTPYQKNNCIKELAVVINDYRTTFGEWNDKKVLEVGCANGYWTRRLYKLNCEFIIAVDADPAAIDLNRFLDKDTSIIYVCDEFDDNTIKLYDQTPFDICLMMNIYNWIRQKIGETRATETLKTINAKVMYFQIPHINSPLDSKLPLRNDEEIKNYLLKRNWAAEKIEENLHNNAIRFLYRCVKLPDS